MTEQERKDDQAWRLKDKKRRAWLLLDVGDALHTAAATERFDDYKGYQAASLPVQQRGLALAESVGHFQLSEVFRERLRFTW